MKKGVNSVVIKKTCATMENGGDRRVHVHAEETNCHRPSYMVTGCQTDNDITLACSQASPSLTVTKPPVVGSHHQATFRRTGSDETALPPEGISLLDDLEAEDENVEYQNHILDRMSSLILLSPRQPLQKLMGVLSSPFHTHVLNNPRLPLFSMVMKLGWLRKSRVPCMASAQPGSHEVGPATVEQSLPRARPGSHGRGLSLKDRGGGKLGRRAVGQGEGGGGKVRYREVGRASHNSSTSSGLSTSSTSLSDRDPSRHNKSSSPSALDRTNSSTTNDSPPSSGSPSSPSLLQSTISPWKQRAAVQLPNDSVSPSVLASGGIPGLIVTPTLTAAGKSLVMVVPGSVMAGGAHIPRTDSQLSLDIFETMPPSPELHSTSRKEQKRTKLNIDAIRSHQIQSLTLQGAPNGSGSGGHCTSSKPPLESARLHAEGHHGGANIKQHSRKMRTKRENQQRVHKQTNFTNIGSNLGSDHQDIVGFADEEERQFENYATGNILLATPGLKPVSVILGEGMLSRNSSSRVPWSSGLKRDRKIDFGSQEDDDEGVLPQKKMRPSSKGGDETSHNLDNGRPGDEKVSEVVVRLDSSLESEREEEMDDVDVTRILQTINPEQSLFDEELSPEYHPTPEKSTGRTSQLPERPVTQLVAVPVLRPSLSHGKDLTTALSLGAGPALLQLAESSGATKGDTDPEVDRSEVVREEVGKERANHPADDLDE